MATRRPISTISYNTESFLKEQLDALFDAHIIQCYQYIFHYGEDGDKDHFHVRLDPNKQIDAMDIAEKFDEYVFGEDKPRRLRPFRNSKEEDWLLYAVHDPAYMKLKYPNDPHEKIPYDWRDIVVSSRYDLEVAFVRAKSSLSHSSASITQQILGGEKVSNMLLRGENPHLVSTISRTLGSAAPYMAAEYTSLTARYNTLLAAIDREGYVVEFINDTTVNLFKEV